VTNKIVKRSSHTPLGVYSDGEKVLLFYHLTRDEGEFFRIEESHDGINFSVFHPICQIINEVNERIDARKISDLCLARVNDRFFLTYNFKGKSQKNCLGATSDNLAGFKNTAKIREVQGHASVVSDYQQHGRHVMFFGEGSIKIAYSYNLVKWDIEKEPVISSKKDFFGESPLIVGNSFLVDEGILLFYYNRKKLVGADHYFIHAALFDKDNPQKLIKLIEDPLWEPPGEWRKMNLLPVGTALIKGELISYWQGRDGVIALVHPFVLDRVLERQHFPHLILKKLRHNPIIRPIADSFWESKATFNPAALYEKGKVHIIYRAIGDEDISVLGYATSLDGLHIDFRSPNPVYEPTQSFEGKNFGRRHKFAYSPFMSGGGGNGGIEDPRLTKIDGRIFMTYVAYDGATHPRVALTSIAEEDFVNNKWNWETSVLISKPNEVNKNACILPEKVKGKYVIFHRVYPDILIDYVDNLNFDGSKYLRGEYKISPTDDGWDNRKIGIGATPLKTDDGWLVIYQAVGNRDSGKYKVGAMILDKNDPTRVLCRSRSPVIEPLETYENEGFKSGVVYPCGAVKLNNELIVYYGGADSVVCAAHENFDYFMEKLKQHREEDIQRRFSLN